MELADPKTSVFKCKTVDGINPYEETYFNDLTTILESTLGSKLCPEMCPSTVSLNYLDSINCNVIVLYEMDKAAEFGKRVKPDLAKDPENCDEDFTEHYGKDCWHGEWHTPADGSGWDEIEYNKAKGAVPYWAAAAFDHLENKPANSWARHLIGGISSGDQARSLRYSLIGELTYESKEGGQSFISPDGAEGTPRERRKYYICVKFLWKNI